MKTDKLVLIGTTLLISTFLLACSEKKSDDPIKSFELWSGQKPDNAINVINGQYWQSAHWTKEYVLYLEAQPSVTWRTTFIKQNNLTLTKERDYPSEAPAWFKPANNCRVWKSPTFDQGSRFFEDSLSGHIYLYETQL